MPQITNIPENKVFWGISCVNKIPISTSFKDDFLRDYVEGKVMKKG
jgi:hypothetical protein